MAGSVLAGALLGPARSRASRRRTSSSRSTPTASPPTSTSPAFTATSTTGHGWPGHRSIDLKARAAHPPARRVRALPAPIPLKPSAGSTSLEGGGELAAVADLDPRQVEPAGHQLQFGGELVGHCLGHDTRLGERTRHEQRRTGLVGLEIDPRHQVLAEQEREHVVPVDPLLAGV